MLYTLYSVLCTLYSVLYILYSLLQAPEGVRTEQTVGAVHRLVGLGQDS